MVNPVLMVKSLGTYASKNLRKAAAKASNAAAISELLPKDCYEVGKRLPKGKANGFLDGKAFALISDGSSAASGKVGFDKKTFELMIKRLVKRDGVKTITKNTIGAPGYYRSQTQGGTRIFKNFDGDKLTYGYQMLNHGSSPAGIYAQTDRNGNILKFWERTGNVNKELPLDSDGAKGFIEKMLKQI